MSIQQMFLGTPLASAAGGDGGSVQFAGGNGNILSISNSNVPTGTASRTIEFWAYIDSNYSSWSNIFSYGGASSGQCFGLNIGNNGNTTRFGFTGYSAGDWLTDTEVMPYTDAWHHFAVTYDGSKVELFINGHSKGTSSESLNTTGSNFVVGGSEHSGNNENFKGWISNLRVSDNVRYTSYTYSNMLTGNLKTQTAGFDGNLWGRSEGTGGLTFTPTTPISYSTSVEVYDNNNVTKSKVNSGSFTTHTTSGWATIESGSGTINSMYFERTDNAGWDAGFYAIRVDGVMLQDGYGFEPSETALTADGNTTLICCHDSTGADKVLGASGSMTVGGGCTARTATPFWFPDPHRYWRFSEGSANGYDSHFPRVARIGLTKYRDPEAAMTWIKEYTADNCSDSGTYQVGVFTYDHGSPISFKYCVLSSVFNSSIRSCAYQIDYSDDNSNWTTAWIGVAHNQNDWPSNGQDKNSNSRSICGYHIMEGSRLGTTNPNNGTTWSNSWTAQGSSFDMAISNVHDGRLRMTDRARTSGNSVYCYLTCNITVENSVTVYGENNYPSTSEIVVDGVTYTTSGKHVHRFEGISGNLTKVSVDNDGQNGRTYIEAVVVDGYLLMDGVGHEGWIGTGN